MADVPKGGDLMPLLDHFRPPLASRRHWESFHSGWAYEMARWLNRTLIPAGYLAEPVVTLGTQLQVDVAAFDEREEPTRPNDSAGGTATALQTWAPPDTALTMPAIFPDDIEVQIFQTEGGSHLVAAVELVSPRNKDRPEARRGFAAKCAAYLQRGIGLVVADIVTTRQQNLHDELADLLGQPPAPRYPTDSLLYVVAYRPSGREGVGQIELWPIDLTLGLALPTVPLALRNGPTVPLDLETTYMDTRQSLGV
jgi:hypothetical protein